MGTSTMKFNEGIIVSGSAANTNNTASDYALIVSGSQFIDAEGGGHGLTIFKEESDSAFIRFINSDDPSSWYAYIAFDAAENMYIAPGRSQDFYLQTRTGVGSDPITFPFRVYDNGKAKFDHGELGPTASTNLPADVVFFVSGSTDNERNAVFGGNLITSGNLEINGRESAADETYIQFKEADEDRAKIGINTSNNLILHNQYMNKHIVFKVNDQGQTREGLRIDGSVPEVVVNEGSESLVDFRVESNNNTHMLFVDGGNERVGIKTNAPVCELDVNGTVRTKAFGVNVRDVNSTSAVQDLDYILRCIQSSAITVTLPAKNVNSGRVLIFKDVLGNAGSHNITIDGDGSDTIDGAATHVININKQSVTMICDGINGWMITSKYTP